MDFGFSCNSFFILSFSIVNSLFSMNVTLHVDTRSDRERKQKSRQNSFQEFVKSGPKDIAFLERYFGSWLVY
jgi:hypothetical protein